MALIDCKFFSETLGMACSMRVILPETGSTHATQLSGSEASSRVAAQADGDGRTAPHRTLFLLHGLGDDETIWTRQTSIERSIAPFGVAVVMPNVHRSFYSNMKHGYRYWDFVSGELLDKARSFFPLSLAREDNFVAGSSMGGYGAFKLALSRPESFAAAASLSGVMDLAEWRPDRASDFRLVFGDAGAVPGTGLDLFHVARTLAASPGPKPRLYQCCGSEDFLHTQNLRFRDFVKPLGFDHEYRGGTGDHTWTYWDKMLVEVLDWLFVTSAPDTARTSGTGSAQRC